MEKLDTIQLMSNSTAIDAKDCYAYFYFPGVMHALPCWQSMNLLAKIPHPSRLNSRLILHIHCLEQVDPRVRL